MHHPTTEQLHQARSRYSAEAIPASFQTRNYRLRYITWGTGSPVVFVHGLADLPESFCMVMQELVDRKYCVISYHLANGLDDDCKVGPYQHHHFAQDLVGLIEHLGFDSVDIMGSSFGSTVTLRALTLSPQRFRRVVLQGGFARRPLIRIERGLSRLARYWPGRMKNLMLREVVMQKMDGPQFVGCPPEVYQFLLDCSGETPIRAAARRGLILDKLDLRPLLPSIRQPVLMIGGDRDGLVSRANEAEVEAGLPDVKRVEFSPCGHYPQYTMPKQMALEMLNFYGSR
jgi:pimeloyl-ACP methyl ester carboxylesterase